MRQFRKEAMQNSKGIAQIIEEAAARLMETHAARETAFPLTRQVIHACAASIRAAHRHQYDDARALLQEAHGYLESIRQALKGRPEIYYTGYVSDAQKEFAEANATLAFLSGGPLPTPAELAVEAPAYLNGLAEAASELRRTILDALRRDDFDRCEAWMATMDEVYSRLVAVDFPDAVTGGLRRTTDQFRGVLERTRGDLTMALRQRSLERKLAEFQEGLSG